MDKKLAHVPINGDSEFNPIVFEKKLTALKDSQESINLCCRWCLENRHHHKKIVCCWLNVLKRVKLEQRLTLFYLANDVIQYSKRRNYDFVESWGTTLQRATTLVREDKVKHKILRIFKIWEQRGIYTEEFVSDLCGLISVSPTPKKTDEPHEFQASYLIQKIRTCSTHETETDARLRKLKNHNPKMQHDCGESLVASLKDRAHVDDVEKELEDYTKHMESYVNALNTEIKARIQLISLLSQAQTQLEKDRRDVKLVTNAYKTFGTRVKAVKKKLDEKMTIIPSPVPSPDINAPSPSPDSDIDLPLQSATSTTSPISKLSPPSQSMFLNANYYNPAPGAAALKENAAEMAANFTSFLGSNVPFDLQSITNVFNESKTVTRSVTPQLTNASNLTSSIKVRNMFPVPGDPVPTQSVVGPPIAAPYNNGSHRPLLPPPMPPFSKNEDGYTGAEFNEGYNGNVNVSYGNSFDSSTNTAPYPNRNYSLSDPQIPPTYPNSVPSAYSDNYNPTFPPNPTQFKNSAPNFLPHPPYPQQEEYNPEEEPETWEAEAGWDQPPLDQETPDSPPLYEKESYNDPIEYHDRVDNFTLDIDQRIVEAECRGKDIDHRNLISLTNSPGENTSQLVWPRKEDQDYRTVKIDQDYRVPFHMDSFDVTPPPPPPLPIVKNPPYMKHDNMDNIDMDLSEDDFIIHSQINNGINVGEKVLLKPPPPFPDFLDDYGPPNAGMRRDERFPLPPQHGWDGEFEPEPHWERPPFRGGRGGSRRSFRPRNHRRNHGRGNRGGPRFRPPFRGGF